MDDRAISDADLAAILRASPDCVIVSDIAGQVLEFSDAAVATLGYSRTAAVGQRVRELIVPLHLRDAYHSMVMRHVDRTAEQPRVSRGEVEVMRADGTIFSAEAALTEARVTDRRYFTLTLRDISERKQAERDGIFLTELSDRLRQESDASAALELGISELGRYLGLIRVGFGEIDEAQTTVTVRWDWTDGSVPKPPVPRTHSIDQLGPDNLAPAVRGEMLIVDDVHRDRRVASQRSTYDAASVRSLVMVPLVRGGRLRAICFVQREVPHIWQPRELTLAREVAERSWATLERARAEAELRSSQAMLAAFMENAPVGMYVKDAEGRYILANPVMSKVFGRPASEVIGKTAGDLFPPDEATTSMGTFGCRSKNPSSNATRSGMSMV